MPKPTSSKARVAAPEDLTEVKPQPLALECFAVEAYPCEVVPGRPDRAWMDQSSNRHAYRCLPLSMANTSGWDVLCPVDFSVTWNGGPDLADLTTEIQDRSNRHIHFAKSHFAQGIVTLHTGWIFRTPPGFGMWTMPPPNEPRDGISALTGLIETDWLPYPFTVNWKMTRPGTVYFKKGESLSFLVPMQHGRLEDFRPVRRALEDDPALDAQHTSFRESREAFGQRLAAGEEEALRRPWERHYFVGRVPGHPEVCPVHTNKRRLKGLDKPITVVKQEHTPAATPSVPIDSGFPMEAGYQMRLLGVNFGGGQFTPLVDLAKLMAPAESIARVVQEPNPASPMIIGHSSGADSYPDYEIINRYIAGYPVYCEPDFLAPDEARLLCETFENNKHLTARGATGADAIWNDRFIFLNSLPPSERQAKRLMQDARARIMQRVDAHYTPDRPFYSDTIQLVRWLEGMEMPVHADNCNHHTGEPNGVPHRDFAAVVYLNDDYEGGDLVLPPLKARVVPKAGMLICFKASADHAHGVTRVTRGVRYTMPGWYTFDITKRDRSCREIY